MSICKRIGIALILGVSLATNVSASSNTDTTEIARYMRKRYEQKTMTSQLIRALNDPESTLKSYELERSFISLDSAVKERCLSNYTFTRTCKEALNIAEPIVDEYLTQVTELMEMHSDILREQLNK